MIWRALLALLQGLAVPRNPGTLQPAGGHDDATAALRGDDALRQYLQAVYPTADLASVSGAAVRSAAAALDFVYDTFPSSDADIDSRSCWHLGGAGRLGHNAARFQGLLPCEPAVGPNPDLANMSTDCLRRQAVFRPAWVETTDQFLEVQHAAANSKCEVACEFCPLPAGACPLSAAPSFANRFNVFLDTGAPAMLHAC